MNIAGAPKKIIYELNEDMSTYHIQYLNVQMLLTDNSLATINIDIPKAQISLNAKLVGTFGNSDNKINLLNPMIDYLMSDNDVYAKYEDVTNKEK